MLTLNSIFTFRQVVYRLLNVENDVAASFPMHQENSWPVMLPWSEIKNLPSKSPVGMAKKRYPT